MRGFVRLRRLGERRRLALEPLEAAKRLDQRCSRESSTRVSSVEELAVSVVVAEEKRTDVFAGVARLRPSADDELLAMLDLELEPGA